MRRTSRLETSTGFESNFRIYHVLYGKKVQKKEARRKEVTKNIEALRTVIVKLKEDTTNLSIEVSQGNEICVEKTNELEAAESGIAELTGQIHKYENSLQLCKKQIESQKEQKQLNQKDLLSKKTQLEDQRATLAHKQREYYSSMNAKQGEFDSNALVLDQMKMMRDNLDGKSIKSHMESKVNSLKQNIETSKKSLESDRADLKKRKKEMDDRAGDLKKTEESCKETNRKMERILEDIQAGEAEKNKAITDSLNQSLLQTESKDKLYELQTKCNDLRKRFEIGSDVQLGALLKLIGKLHEEKVDGFYGILADLVEFEDSLLTPIESLVGNTLFSIVVKDESVAKVVDVVNKAIKGPVVQIYPLSWLSENTEEEFEYPDARDVIILEKFIKPKEAFSLIGLEPLIKEVFGRNIVVNKLEDAHHYAKKYNCDCITFSGEIVYSKDFLAQLGFQDKLNNRLSHYLKFSEIYTDIQKKKKAHERIEQVISSLKEKEFKTSERVSNLKLEKEKLRIQEQNLRSEMVGLEKACIQLKKIISDIEQRIANQEQEVNLYEKDLKELNAGLAGGMKLEKFDEKKFKECNSLSEKYGQEVKDAMNKIEELTESISKIDREIESIIQGLDEANRKQTESHKLENELVKQEAKRYTELLQTLKERSKEKAEARRKVKSELEAKQAAVGKAEESLRSMKDKLEKVQLDLQKENQVNFDLRISIESFQTKIASLNIDDEDDAAALKELQHKSDKDLIQKLQKLMLNKIKYTEKDKANFQKLEEYFKAHNEYDSELKELKLSKKAFIKLVEHVDEQIAQFNDETFHTFKLNFEKVFKKLVPKGKAELEYVDLPKIKPTQPDNGRRGESAAEDNGGTENKGIRIVPAFEGMSHSATSSSSGALLNLSPGQRTILSICIIIALQRCTPSPFYCFDEVDADLDTASVKGITKLMQDISEESQIFVTTFRPESLHIKNSIIFKVEMNRNESEALKIDGKNAEEFLSRA